MATQRALTYVSNAGTDNYYYPDLPDIIVLYTPTEGKHMSSLHKLKVADLETIDHLREWVDERLYGSVVVIDTNGEVVIRTGMGIDLGNYLYPLNEEE
jgi:hypothetical protein